MSDFMFSEEELREIGGYYRNLWRGIRKVRELVCVYQPQGGGSIKFGGREIDQSSVILILQKFLLAREEFGIEDYIPEVESFWCNGSSRTARAEIMKAEKFFEAISGAKLTRPETVKKFLEGGA